MSADTSNGRGSIGRRAVLLGEGCCKFHPWRGISHEELRSYRAKGFRAFKKVYCLFRHGFETPQPFHIDIGEVVDNLIALPKGL
uniref:Uncharacterized protein n=1 Tax=Utricularia reniformis TaxID=192314 RepID=A0A1Y0B259_9LAMI|nr:hypothetical protein AEK19_MT1264 [Utricularia reniformis]ART31471.1 hypothetical protein AEK19_MT1264 [Utricularia reniformis]